MKIMLVPLFLIFILICYLRVVLRYNFFNLTKNGYFVHTNKTVGKEKENHGMFFKFEAATLNRYNVGM